MWWVPVGFRKRDMSNFVIAPTGGTVGLCNPPQNTIVKCTFADAPARKAFKVCPCGKLSPRGASKV